MSLQFIRTMRRVMVGLGAFLLLLAMWIPAVLAVSNPITVTHEAAVVHYPNFIDFQLTASDAASPIGQATLYILYGATSPSEVQRAVPISKPAHTLSLGWHEDISPGGGNPQAIGTNVEYYWTLQDNIGHTMTVLPQSFAITGSSSNVIIVTSQSDTVHFPQYIDYHMTAVDTQSPITQATIFVMQGSGLPLAQHTITISKPGATVTVDWHEDTSGANFMTPGTPLSYYWLLQDRANNAHTDTTQQFSTVDTRFTWQSLAQGSVHVHWYSRPQDFGQLLLSQATTSITHITSKLGVGLLQPINLWVYQTPNDFHGALSPNSYEWVGGEAFPRLNQAFISVTDPGDPTLNRDMPHELTHLVFHQHTAIFAPTWFDEGLAVYNQFYHEPEMSQAFDDAVSSNSLLHLSDISDGFSSDTNKAYLAYAQSWQLLAYMYQTFGQTRMTHLFQSLSNANSNFDGDLTQALGMDEFHIENQWHISLHLPPTLAPDTATPTPVTAAQPTQQRVNSTDATIPILIGFGTVLILLSLAVVAILLIRQKRQKAAAVTPFAGPITPYPFLPNMGQQPANGPVYPMNNGANYYSGAQYQPGAFPQQNGGPPFHPGGERRQGAEQRQFMSGNVWGGAVPGGYVPPAPPEPENPMHSTATYQEYSSRPQSHPVPQE